MGLDHARERANRGKVTAILFRARGQSYPVAFLDGDTELERIDGIQAKPLDKERRLALDLGSRYILELERVDYQFLDLIFKRLHSGYIPR